MIILLELYTAGMREEETRKCAFLIFVFDFDQNYENEMKKQMVGL